MTLRMIIRRNLKGSNASCSVEVVLVSYWRIESDAFSKSTGCPCANVNHPELEKNKMPFISSTWLYFW